MSKRQVKIDLNQLSGLKTPSEKLSVIMKNGSVFFVEIISLKSDFLKVKNTRGQKMELPLNQVAEIWAEEKVAS